MLTHENDKENSTHWSTQCELINCTQEPKTAQSYSNRCILAAVWIHGELRIIKQIYVYNQLTMSNISRPLSREMFIFSPKRCWHIWLAMFKITR